MDTDRQLYEEISALLDSKREDTWWDFKQEHYHDNVSLIHDIICMANTRANRDAYLILGIEDKTCAILGVENDANRKNQQMLTDILRHVPFAGGVRPKVEVRTLTLSGHEVDVFIIKNSSEVPYYLDKDYSKSNTNKRLRRFHIYTRVQDSNTPIDQSADFNDVEFLWKKRFGMLDTPLNLFHKLLLHPEDWQLNEEDAVYYHTLYPQFTVQENWNRDEQGMMERGSPAIFHLVQCDDSARYGTAYVRHYTTKIYWCQISTLDGGRMVIPCPDIRFINWGGYDLKVSYRYYTKDSLKYALLKMLLSEYDTLTGSEASYAIRRMMDVVLLFRSEDDERNFSQYVTERRHLYERSKSTVNTQTIRFENRHPVDQGLLLDALIMKSLQSEFDSSPPTMDYQTD